MSLGFSSNFNAADFKSGISLKVERINQALTQILTEVGRDAVIDGKGTETYTDRTGNLRNSIAYGVARNGVQAGDQITQVTVGDGTNAGAALVESVIEQKKESTHVLAIVAGMNYAPYVEARGFDVLTSAIEIAKAKFGTQMNELRVKLQAP